MMAPPIRTRKHLPDDAFRAELARALIDLKDWSERNERSCLIESREDTDHWWMKAEPFLNGACAFEFLIQSDQRFSIVVAGEAFEDQPVTNLGFFVTAADAISRGDVERVIIEDAATAQRLAVETRINLGDGRHWVAERRLSKRANAIGIRRIQTFLPYRRIVT